MERSQRTSCQDVPLALAARRRRTPPSRSFTEVPPRRASIVSPCSVAGEKALGPVGTSTICSGVPCPAWSHVQPLRPRPTRTHPTRSEERQDGEACDSKVSSGVLRYQLKRNDKRESTVEQLIVVSV